MFKRGGGNVSFSVKMLNNRVEQGKRGRDPTQIMDDHYGYTVRLISSVLGKEQSANSKP